MAVRLRLRRVGRKKLPIYKVVATDSRSPRDGRYIEEVGQYEPLRHTNNVEFNEDRVMYWLQNGAQPTDTVRNLLSGQGLWLKWSLLKKGADEGVISEQMEKFAAQRAEKEQRVQEKAAQKKKAKPVAEAQETQEEHAPAAEATEKAEEQPAETETPEKAESKETQETPEEGAKTEDEAAKEPAQEKQPEDQPDEQPDEKPDEQDSDKNKTSEA